MAYLSGVQWRVVWVLGEQKHVYEVDEDAGGPVRVLRPEGDPLEDDHEDQVSEEAEHEHQLWQQHQEHTAQLPKVADGWTEKTAGGVKTQCQNKRGQI